MSYNYNVMNKEKAVAITDLVFIKLVKQFNLKHGDVSPEQAQIIEQFESFLVEYVHQNCTAGGTK